MQSNSVPEELKTLRQQIDELDEELVKLLAERFSITDRVGKLKAASGMEPADPAREEEKLDSLRALAGEKALNGDFVLDLYKRIFSEVVNNHRHYLKNHRSV